MQKHPIFDKDGINDSYKRSKDTPSSPLFAPRGPKSTVSELLTSTSDAKNIPSNHTGIFLGYLFLCMNQFKYLYQVLSNYPQGHRNFVSSIIDLPKKDRANWVTGEDSTIGATWAIVGPICSHNHSLETLKVIILRTVHHLTSRESKTATCMME